MLRARLVALLVGLWFGLTFLGTGCKDEFSPPAPPDLYKVPHRYDLGDGADRDLSVEGEDMAGNDLAVVLPVVDLALHLPDLAQPTDGG